MVSSVLLHVKESKYVRYVSRVLQDPKVIFTVMFFVVFFWVVYHMCIGFYSWFWRIACCSAGMLATIFALLLLEEREK